MSEEKKVESLADLPELERECADCRGKGGRISSGEWYDCPFCHGAGFHPTAFGKQVLNLIRHNLRIEEGHIDWR